MGHAIEKDDACRRAPVYQHPIRRIICVCVCVCTFLNSPGKRAEGHNDPAPALSIRACVSRPHAHIYTRTERHVCSGRENRPRRAKACPIRGTSARYRTICLENNGNERAERARMNIQGLSNDWVSQKSGLLPTRDSSVPPSLLLLPSARCIARRGMQI